MMSNNSFDLVVIGAGPGGYHAAIRGSQLGLKVAIIERDDGSGIGGLGGVCLNWGCIPSKALLKNAEILNHIKNADKWGIEIQQFTASMSAAVDRSRNVSSQLTKGIGFLLRKNNIELFNGNAKLESHTEVSIDSKEIITGRHIVIATGARARSLPGLEIDGTNIITSRHALELKERPKTIGIIGASAIGCEFAYYFNSYGSKVVLFEALSNLVPKEDEDISKELERQFTKQGIEFRTNVAIQDVEQKQNNLVLKYEIDGNLEELECDKIMLGVGVQPNSDGLGLENIGVTRDKNGYVEVDEFMRTNIDNIFSVGDVNGKLQLAHVAFDQGIVAAEIIAGQETDPIENYFDMPRCTYCQPQIASIGLTESQARQQGIDVKIGRVPFQVAGKSVAIDDMDGFVKVIINEETGEVVGTHIIGPEATELIAEIGMLKLLEGTNVELQRLTHAHPTLSEALKEAGAAVTNEAIHF